MSLQFLNAADAAKKEDEVSSGSGAVGGATDNVATNEVATGAQSQEVATVAPLEAPQEITASESTAKVTKSADPSIPEDVNYEVGDAPSSIESVQFDFGNKKPNQMVTAPKDAPLVHIRVTEEMSIFNAGKRWKFTPDKIYEVPKHIQGALFRRGRLAPM